MTWALLPFTAILLELQFHGVLPVPQIVTFDKFAQVTENSGVNVPLSTIECDDTNGDPVAARLQLVTPSSPCYNCFEVLSCFPDYCLQYRAGVGTLVYTSVQYYLARVVCETSTETSAAEVIQIAVIPNTPPFFSPDTLLVEHTINAASTAANVPIYDVDALDEDVEDTISYSMQVVPSTASFGFTIDSSSGQISSAVDLREVCEPHVTFLVTASDGRDSSSTLVIDSQMTSANIAPLAMNLNTDVEIPEDATGNVFLMNFIDGNGDGLTYTYTTTNAPGLAQFTFIGDPPNVDVATALNYEVASLRQTYLTIQATDGFCQSPQYYLRLKVVDVNEPPVLSPTRKTVTICEGQREHDPDLTLLDEDTDDTHTWSFDTSMNNQYGRYAIDRETGFIRTTLDYDVDNGAMWIRGRHVIVVTDKGGLTATSTVTVSFLDCNDNAPYFDGSLYRHRRTYYVTECAAGASIVGRVYASDEDSDTNGNNVLTYSGSAGCCRSDTQGRIIVDSILPAGNVITFEVNAVDQGTVPGPLTSVRPAVVTIVFTVCPTTTTAAAATTTTTTSRPDTTDSHENLPWIIVAALLGVAFLSLLLYMCWRYGRTCTGCKCEGRVRRAKPKPPEPIEQPHRGPASRPFRDEPDPAPVRDPLGPATFWNFWKTNYMNDSSKTVPAKNKKPEPGDMRHVADLVHEPLEDDRPPSTQTQPPPPKKTRCCNIL